MMEAPEKVYFGYWDKPTWEKDPVGLEGVKKDFAPYSLSYQNGDGGPVPDDIRILFAIYHDPWGYSGQAFVIFEQAGKLFFVEGSHCSCFGLEGQWEPAETSAEALRLMNEKGTQFDNLDGEARAALCRLIERLSVAEPTALAGTEK